MSKPKLTEQDLDKLLETDVEAIAFRKRIEKTERILGKAYGDRIRADYEEYIRCKYRC
jgi:hypothetical protein